MKTPEATDWKTNQERRTLSTGLGFVLFLMAQPESLNHRANLAISVDKPSTVWVECGNTSSQLASILQVQKHAGN